MVSYIDCESSTVLPSTLYTDTKHEQDAISALVSVPESDLPNIQLNEIHVFDRVLGYQTVHTISSRKSPNPLSLVARRSTNRVSKYPVNIL